MQLNHFVMSVFTREQISKMNDELFENLNYWVSHMRESINFHCGLEIPEREKACGFIWFFGHFANKIEDFSNHSAVYTHKS